MQDTDNRFDQTDDECREIFYEDCADCGNTKREDELCRRHGPMSRIVERTASLQMRAKLNMSLMRQTGNESYLRAANRLAHWSRIWITAGQMLEGLVPRRACRLICATCKCAEKFNGGDQCFRCVFLPGLAP